MGPPHTMYACLLLVLVAAIQGPCLSDGSLIKDAVAPLDANPIVESQATVDLDRKKKPKPGKRPKPGKKPTKPKPGKKPGKKPTKPKPTKPKPGKNPGKNPGNTGGNGGTPGDSTTPCSCGVKKDTKIVNGKNANEFEWPWIARLSVKYNSGTYQCGGSLIADQWILTAAHCTATENGKLPQVTVYLGDHN